MGECNADGHPIDDFTRECCANCVNPECTRSLSGKAKFDERTNNWFEHYFGDKNRMDPSDARFSKIAGQKFILIDPGLTGRAPDIGGSSAWLDPRDIERQQPAAPAPPPRALAAIEAMGTLRGAPAERPAPAAPPPQQVQQPPPQAPPPARPQQVHAAPPPRQVPQHLLLANAPVQAPQRIAGPPSASTAPPKDPWAGPVPDAKDDAPVVSPGARVKLGGGGGFAR